MINKIEIVNKDESVLVEYTSCDCGTLTERICWKQTEYKCKSCGKKYKRVFDRQYRSKKLR
ncbi:transcriptional regulator [Enterococcus faecalis]|nr:transcriptional regulator [Enterococcus faecalis]EGO9445303.1 transcriptional regulator [Enterococcus faecalis]